MLRPGSDFVAALPLNHAVVNLRVDSLVPHEVCEVASTLQTRVPDDVLGAVARTRSLFFGGSGGSWFRHFKDSSHDSAGSFIAKWSAGCRTENRTFRPNLRYRRSCIYGCASAAFANHCW